MKIFGKDSDERGFLQTLLPIAAQAGLSYLSSRKAKKNIPQVPQFQRTIYPTQDQLYNNPTLRDLIDKRLKRGEDLGYGPDFVSKTTNPVAESMRRNFQNVTSPFLSSQYSSRGLGQSSLAANAQGVAEGDVESNIGDLMAKFYGLNEAQKKRDTEFAANLGEQTNQEEGQMRTRQALSDAGVNDFNLKTYPAQVKQAGAGNLLNLETLKNSGIGKYLDTILGKGQSDSSVANPTHAKILQNRDSDLGGFDIQSLIQALKLVGSRGGNAYGY